MLADAKNCAGSRDQSNVAAETGHPRNKKKPAHTALLPLDRLHTLDMVHHGDSRCVSLEGLGECRNGASEFHCAC